MASAGDQNENAIQEEDELEKLFKTFDTQYHDLQQKFSDMERTLQDIRNRSAADDETSPDA